jgi:hypothetical protein
MKIGEQAILIYKQSHYRDVLVMVATNNEIANEFIKSKKFPGEYYTEEILLNQQF